MQRGVGREKRTLYIQYRRHVETSNVRSHKPVCEMMWRVKRKRRQCTRELTLASANFSLYFLRMFRLFTLLITNIDRKRTAVSASATSTLSLYIWVFQEYQIVLIKWEMVHWCCVNQITLLLRYIRGISLYYLYLFVINLEEPFKGGSRLLTTAALYQCLKFVWLRFSTTRYICFSV